MSYYIIPERLLCDRTSSFDWQPQHVLVGFATKVLENTSLNDCLASCLRSSLVPACRSVVYFHDSRECVLNEKTRAERPDLLTENTEGYIVDYLENRCVQRTSPLSMAGECAHQVPNALQYTRAIDMALPALKAVMTVELDKCRAICDANKVHTISFEVSDQSCQTNEYIMCDHLK